uniref:Terpene synthase 1 n=1 Tax=Euphorbia poissonii TaxID=212962 RepID=A0A977Q550_9ROSI|nr:terpene synthase 1 [Euphorbia poissonii]
MEFSFSLSTAFFTIPEFHYRRHLFCNSPTPRLTCFCSRNCCFSPLRRPASSLGALSSVSFLARRRSTACFCSPSMGARATVEASDLSPEVIILDVGGMTDNECANSVKRILQNQAQVYVASVNLAKEAAIVWPRSEAKAVPNWNKQLGDELANHLTTCGFKSRLTEPDSFPGHLKNTPYSDLGQSFASLAPQDSELESHTKGVEALKVKAKNLLLGSTKEITENIRIINLLCRLGISYHFEDEIDDQLNRIFTLLPKLLEDNDYDLCTLANLFRILRQHGYNMTSDVFKKFKDANGEFKKDIASDVEGILSLYEACFLAIRGDDILDEALAFTRKHMELLVKNSNPSLQKYIRNALMFPCHRNSERLDALQFISYYEEDECADETLLAFAKLDFNQQQLLYRKELALLSKWWMDTNVMEKFPYIRDRLVESYLWTIGCICEPQYSVARMMLTKYGILMTVMDDTYDTYGTYEQLQLLTAALQGHKTEIGGDKLPEYMKHICRSIFEELENDGSKVCSYKASYLEETIKEFAETSLMEAKWKKEGKAPSFDEYIKNGKVTCLYEVFTSVFILGMENLGMKEILWLRNNPDIADGSKLVSRLLNDIVGRKDEKERQDFPKGVDCYMKQYGVSEDVAIEAMQKMIENAWEVMNEDLLKPNNISRTLLKFTLNSARMALVLNGASDVFTYPSDLKELIVSIFFNPLPM